MKKKRILLGIALASASIFALASCGSSDNNPDDPQPQETDEQSTKATVTFNTNGGGTIAPQELDKGDRATQPDNPTKDGFVFLGWYAASDFSGDPFDFTTAINANITLYAKWKVYDPFEDFVRISNKDELLAFRANSENNTKNAILTADIDLAGTTLEESKLGEYSGVFDGQGHTIKNAFLDGVSGRIGVLFNYVVGGTIKNIKFTGCSIKTNSDGGVGIVTGTCNGGTFEKIEFNACTVTNQNTYAGMVFGRNEKKSTINIDQVTSKNNCISSCSQYGGFLVGDIKEETTLNITNVDIDGEFAKSTGNGSFLVGRVRQGATVNVENAVVKAKVSGTPAKNGVLLGGGKDVFANYKNVVAIAKNSEATLFGDNRSRATAAATDSNAYTFDNVHYNGVTITDPEKEIANIAEVAATAVTPDWLKTTLKLDFTSVWMTEGEGNAKYRLVASSTNVKSAGATLAQVSVSTANAKVRFKKGDAFTSEGLVVFGTYSDDVQLVLNSDEYTIVSSTYDANTVDNYTITVKGVEDETKTATYTVKLVEQVGFEINSEFAQKVFSKGTDLNSNNLVVYSKWSDDILEKLAKTDYNVDSTYEKNTAGEYTVSVTNKDYDAKTYKVSVVDTKPIVAENHVYVNVDKNATLDYQGKQINGVETFNTVTGALEFLNNCKFDDDVIKVVYIGEGTYHEKIDTSLVNLHLIGAGDSTIITYSAVESTVNPLNEKTYSLNDVDCATVHINGKFFSAENLQIRNDFDYINDHDKESSPQGLALTINGDGAVLKNVHLYGNQDTLYLKSGRAYFSSCLIEGNVDFIFGNNKGIGYFEGCTIKAVYRGNDSNNGYITAMKAEAADKPTYGYVFKNCTITADDNVKAGSMSLGRPWGKKATVAFIDCSFSDAYSKLAYTDDNNTKSRWFSMSGSPVDADFAEYGSTGDGAITTAVRGGSILTAEQAGNYTIANVLGTENGNVTFNDDIDFVARLTALIAETNKTDTASIKVSSPQDDATTTDVIDVSVERNKTFDISYYVSPWNSTNKTIEFEYDNTKLEFNQAEGKIKGLVEGATTFVVKQGSISTTVNVTVTAPTGTYTVTFMDGTNVIDTKTGHETDAIDFTSIDTTKTGFQFVRWYEDKDFTKVYSDTTIPGADKTVYARYIDLNVANVVYIDTAAELVEAMGNVASSQKTYYITADIDMDGINYAGLTGNNNSSFYGFGYAIKNWSVAGAAAETSFFGKLYNGTVDSIVFKNCSITTANNYVAILASGIYSDEIVNCITFDHCTIDGVEDTYGQYIGMLAANGVAGVQNSIETLTVTNIASVGSVVKGGQYSGGLFGRTNAANITLDGFTGDITFVSAGSNNKNSGGVIGWIKNNGFTIKNSTASIVVNNIGSTTAGGKAACLGGVLGGIQAESEKTAFLTVEKCDLTITMSNVGSYSGGIVGQDNTGTTATFILKDTDVDFNISCAMSAQNVGGVIGRIQATTTFTANNVELSGSITATDYDSNTKNYAAGIGNCGSSAVISLTDVAIGDLTIRVASGQKANTVIGNGTVNATEVAKVTYAASKVDIKADTTSITSLQGTNTEA